MPHIGCITVPSLWYLPRMQNAPDAKSSRRKSGRENAAIPDFSPSNLVQNGKEARRQGDYLTALDLFQKAHQASPQNPGLEAEVADVLRRLGRASEAESVFYAVLQRSPNHLAALSGLARCARDAGDHALALTRFVTAAAQANSEPGPYQELAEAQFQAGLLDQAAVNFGIALARAPKLSAAMAGLAKCARRNGDLHSALMHIQYACAEAPANLGLRVQLADDLRELDRLSEAETEIAAVLVCDPCNVGALLAAARLSRRQSQPERLFEIFERVRAIDAEEPRAVIGLIAAHRDFGDIEKARALIHELLKITPNHVQALIELGTLERLCGDHLAALEAFKAAQRIEPGRTEIRLSMAREYMALGDHPQSEALLAATIANDPSNVQATLVAAKRSMMADDHMTALAIVKDRLAKGAKSVALLVIAAEALGRLGRASEALAMLNLARHMPGNQVDATVKRLTLLRQAGLWTEALREARRANAATPNVFAIGQQLFQLCLLIGTHAEIEHSLAALDPKSRTDRAQCAALSGVAAEERGDLPDAIEHYQKAIILLPTGPEPYRLLSRAYVLSFNFHAALNLLRQHTKLTLQDKRLRQLSVNWSQTHIGQIVNECMLDREAYAAIQSILTLKPTDRKMRALELMRSFVDNTLVALVLVDALWRNSEFDRPLAVVFDTTSATIPRTIVQFWNSPDPPDDIAGLMESWLAHNDDFGYVKFDEAAAELFLETRHPPAVLQAFRRALQPAMKADLFRLAYLSIHGGIYVDADDRCHATLLPLLSPGATLVLYREDLGTLGNNFIAAVPGHSVIETALSQAVSAINRGDDELLWLATGPGLLTRAFALKVSQAASSEALISETRIWHRRAIYQCIAMHCVTAHKRTKSYWGNAAFQQSTSGVRKMTISAKLEARTEA